MFEFALPRTLIAGAALVLASPVAGAHETAAGPLPETVVRARADALLGRMTAEEKAAQITQYFYAEGQGQDPATPVADAVPVSPGALLFVSDPAQINRLQRRAVAGSRLGIPMLFGFDVVHGLRTILPVPIGMAASWDPGIVEAGQRMAAAEARAVGIHWTFAPNVDIARDPRWGRIVEGAGEDPYLGAAMAAAQVRGFQGPYLGSAGHVIAGTKHFAGYGAALGGRDYDEVELSENALRNVYLKPFAAAVAEGTGSVMSAYMGLDGVPASGNRWLLHDVLRGDLGFDGFVVSDAGAVFDLVTHGLASDLRDAGVRALGVGVDMEMATPANGSGYRTLPQSLASGAIGAGQLDAAVRRVLEAKIRMGLFEHPYVDVGAARRSLGDRQHREVARIAAERAAVLLRNAGGLLPLDRAAMSSIAVIGRLADSPRDTVGPWVFDQDDRRTVTILAGIRAAVGTRATVDYAPGVGLPRRINPSLFDGPDGALATPAVDDTREIARAVVAARAADLAVLVLGEEQNTIGENASRSSLELPGRQRDMLDAVIATGRPVVVVLMNGRPLNLGRSEPAAILEVWYPGSEGGNAVANLLFGDATPGGKLPFTWPRNVGQVPLIYAHLRSHAPNDADKRYLDDSNAPVYPFGFGLSYSTFAFSNLKVAPQVRPGETIDVAVDVANTGPRAADEVAQLYVHQRYGTAARPVRELKGFRRLTLKPGEVATVHFALSAEDRRYWSAATRGWVEDETVFDVWVGGSSEAGLAGRFEVRR